MSNEFRPIPKAPLYEMDTDGFIRKIDKKTPALPYPLGSDNVILMMDQKDKSKRSPFKISELVEEVWGTKKSKKEETIVGSLPVGKGTDFLGNLVATESSEEKWDKYKSERAKDTALMPSSGVPSPKEEKASETKPNAEKEAIKSNDPKVNKIMKLNCMMSQKIWKLHQMGLKIDEIKAIVQHPHSVGALKTIENYKKKPKLRENADKVK